MPTRILTLLCLFATAPTLMAQSLPDGAVARLGNTRFVAHDKIKAIAISPDGKRFATASGADIHIWDAGKGHIVREIKTHAKLYDSIPFVPRFRLAWSNNGQLLAVVMCTGELRILDARTGRRFWYRVPYEATLNKLFEEMRFLGDDRWLAIVLQNGDVDLWNVARAARVRTWKKDEEKQAKLKAAGTTDFISVTLSPSGRLMVWAIYPHGEPRRSTALIYETVSGKFVREVKDLPPAERIYLLDEGETLLIQPWTYAKQDHALANYAIIGTDGQLRHKLTALPGRIAAEQASGDTSQPVLYGKSLLIQDKFGPTHWNLANGKLLRQGPRTFSEWAVAADGKHLIASRGQRLYVGAGGVEALFETPDFWEAPKQVDFMADGRLMAKSETTQYPGGRLSIFDPLKGDLLATQETPVFYRAAPHRIDFGHKILAAFDNKDIFLTDLATGKEVSRLQVKDGPTDWNSINVSPDGKRVLTWEHDKITFRFRWFDSASGKELGRHEVPFREVFPKPLTGYTIQYWTPISFYAHDGSVFGYVTLDSRLALVDCRTGRVQRVVGLSRPMTWDDTRKGWGADPLWSYQSAGFDRLIFGVSRDRSKPTEGVVLDRNGNVLRYFLSPKEWGVNLSADGRMAAERKGRTITFYETATGRKMGYINTTLPAPSNSVVAFSPDGKLLAANCPDTTILVWNINRPLSGKAAMPAPKSAEEAEALWEKLGDPDPAEAYRALWALAAAPAHTLSIMNKRLKPVAALDAKPVQALIEQLDSTKFNVREKASKELRAMNETALPILRAARKSAISPEQEKRLDVVIAHLQSGRENAGPIHACLRELRALEVLERIGGNEARKLVERVAGGTAEALRTREARLVLARWRETTAGP